eukprot:7367913-Pyramimonas_sp.AAC.1
MSENKSLELSSGSPSSTRTSGDSAQEMVNPPVAEILSETTSKQETMEYGIACEKRGASKKGVKACRVPGCTTSDLSNSCRYCLRHRICEAHFK